MAEDTSVDAPIVAVTVFRDGARVQRSGLARVTPGLGPVVIGGLLMAMRVRGERVAELTGAVRAMRARMASITAPDYAIDVCGTGGDGAGTLNVSTAVTFVVAGAGVGAVGPLGFFASRIISRQTSNST